MTHKQKVIRESMDRLREIAKMFAVKDEHGKVLREGYPMPEYIEDELNRVYLLAARKARRK